MKLKRLKKHKRIKKNKRLKIYTDNMGQYHILPNRTKIKKIMKLQVYNDVLEGYTKRKVFVEIIETKNETHIKPVLILEER